MFRTAGTLQNRFRALHDSQEWIHVYGRRPENPSFITGHTLLVDGGYVAQSRRMCPEPLQSWESMNRLHSTAPKATMNQVMLARVAP
jgi:hypothetical protein